MPYLRSHGALSDLIPSPVALAGGVLAGVGGAGGSSEPGCEPADHMSHAVKDGPPLRPRDPRVLGARTKKGLRSGCAPGPWGTRGPPRVRILSETEVGQRVAGQGRAGQRRTS